MKVVKFKDLVRTDREVKCPEGDFISYRYLLKSDNMGFTLTKTHIPKGLNKNPWHYKNHLEACICIKGSGNVLNLSNGNNYEIEPGTMYALDKHDKHIFKAYEDVELICVFNPPLDGLEVHGPDGSYKESEV